MKPMIGLLLVGTLAACGADMSSQLLGILEKNPDPVEISELYPWGELPPGTRAKAVHLIEAGLSEHPEWVSQRPQYLWPRLHMAAFRGQVEITRVLLDHGASMDVDLGPPLHHLSALQAALGLAPAPVYERPHPSPQLLELLLERGAGSTSRRPGLGTRLCSALSSGPTWHRCS